MSDAELSDVGDDDIVREHETQSNAEEDLEESDQGERNVSTEEVKDADNDQTEDKKSDASKKKKTTRSMFVLNTERLKGSKGVHTIEKLFEGFKFEGKGREKKDLDRVMKRLEYWAFRLFPKLEFDDFLAKCEHLGHKKDLQTHLKKYRTGMITADSYLMKDIEENEDDDNPAEMQRDNEFPNENYNNDNFQNLVDEAEQRRNDAFQRLIDETAQSRAERVKPSQVQESVEHMEIDDNDFEKILAETGQVQPNKQSQQCNKPVHSNNEKTGSQYISNQQNNEENQFIDDDEFEKLMADAGEIQESQQTQQHNKSVQQESKLNEQNVQATPQNSDENQLIDDDDFEKLLAETGQI